MGLIHGWQVYTFRFGRSFIDLHPTTLHGVNIMLTAADRIQDYLDEYPIIKGYYSVTSYSTSGGTIELRSDNPKRLIPILEREFPSINFKATPSSIFFELDRSGWDRYASQPKRAGNPPLFYDAEQFRDWLILGQRIAEDWSRHILKNRQVIIFVLDENKRIRPHEIQYGILKAAEKSSKEVADGDESNYHRGISLAEGIWRRADFVVEGVTSPTTGKFGYRITVTR